MQVAVLAALLAKFRSAVGFIRRSNLASEAIETWQKLHTPAEQPLKLIQDVVTRFALISDCYCSELPV